MGGGCCGIESEGDEQAYSASRVAVASSAVEDADDVEQSGRE